MTVILEPLELNKEFNQLASNNQIEKTVQALEANGISTMIFETGNAAREYALTLIPSGAEVYNPPSRTLDEIGLTADIESSINFQSVRSRLHALDHATQQPEIRRLIS